MIQKTMANMFRSWVTTASDAEVGAVLGKLLQVGGVPAIGVTAAPATGIAGKVARGPLARKPAAAKATAKKRGRRTSANVAELREKAIAHVTASDGLAASDVAGALGIDRVQASQILTWATKQGKIAMGGERRFARYAATGNKALAASQAARKGTTGPASGTRQRRAA